MMSIIHEPRSPAKDLESDKGRDMQNSRQSTPLAISPPDAAAIRTQARLEKPGNPVGRMGVRGIGGRGDPLTASG